MVKWQIHQQEIDVWWVTEGCCCFSLIKYSKHIIQYLFYTQNEFCLLKLFKRCIFPFMFVYEYQQFSWQWVWHLPHKNCLQSLNLPLLYCSAGLFNTEFRSLHSAEMFSMLALGQCYCGCLQRGVHCKITGFLLSNTWYICLCINRTEEKIL